MRKNNTDFLAVLCYIVLVLAASLIFLSYLCTDLLPRINIQINWGNFFEVLKLVKDIILLIAVSMASYLVAKKSKVWLIIYIIAIIIFAASTILGFF